MDIVTCLIEIGRMEESTSSAASPLEWGHQTHKSVFARTDELVDRVIECAIYFHLSRIPHRHSGSPTFFPRFSTLARRGLQRSLHPLSLTYIHTEDIVGKGYAVSKHLL